MLPSTPLAQELLGTARTAGYQHRDILGPDEELAGGVAAGPATTGRWWPCRYRGLRPDGGEPVTTLGVVGLGAMGGRIAAVVRGQHDRQRVFIGFGLSGVGEISIVASLLAEGHAPSPCSTPEASSSTNHEAPSSTGSSKPVTTPRHARRTRARSPRASRSPVIRDAPTCLSPPSEETPSPSTRCATGDRSTSKSCRPASARKGCSTSTACWRSPRKSTAWTRASPHDRSSPSSSSKTPHRRRTDARERAGRRTAHPVGRAVRPVRGPAAPARVVVGQRLLPGPGIRLPHRHHHPPGTNREAHHHRRDQRRRPDHGRL